MQIANTEKQLAALENELALFGLKHELAQFKPKNSRQTLPLPAPYDVLTHIEQDLALSKIEKTLENMSNESEKEYNLFDAFYVHKETQVSNVLAYLFNWTNTLDFENRFLVQFLRTFIKKNRNLILSQKDWEVQLEVNVEDKERGTSRRPDIVLESEHAVIFIENKVFSQAIRQGQIRDTCRYISGKTRWKAKRKVYLILLPSKNQMTKIGGEMEDAKRSIDEVDAVYWGEMAELLVSAKSWAKENSRLYYTISDFAQYAKQIGGIENGI